MRGFQDRTDLFEPPDDDLRALFQRTAPEVTPTDVEALFATVKTSRPYQQSVPSRRLVMTIRITVGTMIAAGVAAAFSFLVPHETTAAFEFAEVQREVAATRTVAFTTTLAFDGQPRMVMRTLVLAPDRLRVEAEGHFTVIDFKARKRMTVDTKHRTVQIKELLTTESPESNLYALFTEVARDPIETLLERSLDGKRALGFVATWHGHEVAIWVDPKTKLPVRVQSTREEFGHTWRRSSRRSPSIDRSTTHSSR